MIRYVVCVWDTRGSHGGVGGGARGAQGLRCSFSASCDRRCVSSFGFRGSNSSRKASTARNASSLPSWRYALIATWYLSRDARNSRTASPAGRKRADPPMGTHGDAGAHGHATGERLGSAKQGVQTDLMAGGFGTTRHVQARLRFKPAKAGGTAGVVQEAVVAWWWAPQLPRNFATENAFIGEVWYKKKERHHWKDGWHPTHERWGFNPSQHQYGGQDSGAWENPRTALFRQFTLFPREHCPADAIPWMERAISRYDRMDGLVFKTLIFLLFPFVMACSWVGPDVNGLIKHWTSNKQRIHSAECAPATPASFCQEGIVATAPTKLTCTCQN